MYHDASTIMESGYAGVLLEFGLEVGANIFQAAACLQFIIITFGGAFQGNPFLSTLALFSLYPLFIFDLVSVLFLLHQGSSLLL